MSKLKRLLGALSLVALFIFSSCVDDEVAPEVTALRQAQVDLLNADVAFRAAQTALKNADVAYRNAQTAGVEATTAGTVLNNEATASNNAVTLAANLNTIAINAEMHKENLIAREKALLIAQQNLAQYLATEGLEEAADYLASWNTVYNGGTVTLPGQAVMTTISNGGIFGVSEKIARQERKLAQLALINNAFDSTVVPQSFIEARLAADVTSATDLLAFRNNTLIAANAALEGIDNPEAPLQEQLLSLAADSVALQATADSIDAAINATAAIRAEADSIVASMEMIAKGGGTTTSIHPNFNSGDTQVDVDNANAISGDPFDNGNYITNGKLYVEALGDTATANAALAVANADAAIYKTYSDSLQAAYDKYQPEVADLDAALVALAADTLEAFNAWQDALSGNGDLELANERAFSDYLIAEQLFLRKDELDPSADNTAVTATDTANYITARKAWDGVPNLSLFANVPNAPNTLITANIALDPTTTNADGSYEQRTGWTSTSYGAGTNPALVAPEGGTWAALIAVVSADLEAAYRDLAFEYLVTAGQYSVAVDEFRRLDSEIDSISGLTRKVMLNEMNPYVQGAGFPAATDIAGSGFFQDYSDDLKSYAVLLKGLSTTISDWPAAVAAEQSAQNAAVAAGLKEITDLTPDVAPYLASYNSSLAFLADIGDSIAALKRAPELALFNAKDALNDKIAMMEDVRDMIDEISAKVLELTDDNGVVEVDPTLLEIEADDDDFNKGELTSAAELEALITTLEGGTPGFNNGALLADNGSIEFAEDDLAVAQSKVTEAPSGVVELAALIAVEQGRLDNYNTELTVYQGFADALQALVLAALAG